jgi:hypothetical protein
MLARLALVLASPLHVAALSSTYYVLRHLYEVTDGANWKNNENWLDGEPCQNDWMSSSHYECFSGELTTEQQPVCCQASATSLATVVKLDLYDNDLSGTIPPELKNLESLRLLVLDSNSLHGFIPPEIGDLYYLKVLWLQNNALSGTIPTELKEHLGAFDEDDEDGIIYKFDPGGVILTPNRFNCSIINGEGMDWANNTLDDLFRDNIAPPEYNEREQDRGCIEDEVDASNVSNVVTLNMEETDSLANKVKDDPFLNVVVFVRRATCRRPPPPHTTYSSLGTQPCLAPSTPSPCPCPCPCTPPPPPRPPPSPPAPLGPPLQFSVAAAAVALIEFSRRFVRSRQHAMGAKSEEEKEEDRAAEQADTRSKCAHSKEEEQVEDLAPPRTHLTPPRTSHQAPPQPQHTSTRSVHSQHPLPLATHLITYLPPPPFPLAPPRSLPSPHLWRRGGSNCTWRIRGKSR